MPSRFLLNCFYKPQADSPRVLKFRRGQYIPQLGSWSIEEQFANYPFQEMDNSALEQEKVSKLDSLTMSFLRIHTPVW